MNYIDVTSLQILEELAEELAARGIRTVVVNLKRHVLRPFETDWIQKRLERKAARIFPTIKTAIRAFEQAKR